MSEDSRDLQEAFAALRREEEARVPPIANLSLRAHKPRRENLGRLVVATACLATIVLAAVWLLPRSRAPQAPEQAAAITSWKPATDFLLDTPGRELLEGVPAIGFAQRRNSVETLSDTAFLCDCRRAVVGTGTSLRGRPHR